MLGKLGQPGTTVDYVVGLLRTADGDACVLNPVVEPLGKEWLQIGRTKSGDAVAIEGGPADGAMLQQTQQGVVTWDPDMSAYKVTNAAGQTIPVGVGVSNGDMGKC